MGIFSLMFIATADPISIATTVQSAFNIIAGVTVTIAAFYVVLRITGNIFGDFGRYHYGGGLEEDDDGDKAQYREIWDEEDLH
jgi:hypothetical protein